MPSAFRLAIAPDSFKGSASAAEVAGAMERGAQRAAESLGLSLGAEILPFADGGEGTLDALCSAWGVSARTAEVTDALGRPVTARYALSADGKTAAVEAAEANGLPRVSDRPLEPLRASSRGVGELVSAVLDAGCEEILLCIGGSASTDGGAGLIQALGVRLLGSDGCDLEPGGGALEHLAEIDTSSADPRASRVRWRIACDVSNPLLGPEGAATVFGPQKGAGAEEILVLDSALARFAEVLASRTGTDVRAQSGTGAAGGLPAALVALYGAEIIPGGTLVAQTLNAQAVFDEADLVLTGEGRLDSQSLKGKVVDTVRRLTPDPTPVLVIAGAVELSLRDQASGGITTALSIATGPQSLEELTSSAVQQVEDCTEQLMRAWLSAERRAQHDHHSHTKDGAS